MDAPNSQRRLLLLAVAASGLVPSAMIAGAQSEAAAVKIAARRFAFIPDEIHLIKGVPAVLELTALDVPMGFNAADFGVRTDLIPGKASMLRFTPQKTGKFVFHCDVFCGSGHEDMEGVIVVDDR